MFLENEKPGHNLILECEEEVEAMASRWLLKKIQFNKKEKRKKKEEERRRRNEEKKNARGAIMHQWLKDRGTRIGYGAWKAISWYKRASLVENRRRVVRSV